MARSLKINLFSVALLSLSSLVSATEQTVVLSIPGMNCPVCPITIKKSLQKIDGVISATVVYKSKLAEVTFNDELTDIKKLRQATTNVGYPSQVKKPDVGE